MPNEQTTDWTLIVWFSLSVIWDILVFGFFGYEIFWRGHSAWWLLFAILATYQPGVYKALYARYGVK